MTLCTSTVTLVLMKVVVLVDRVGIVVAGNSKRRSVTRRYISFTKSARNIPGYGNSPRRRGIWP